jgi:hypothetical protein
MRQVLFPLPEAAGSITFCPEGVGQAVLDEEERVLSLQPVNTKLILPDCPELLASPARFIQGLPVSVNCPNTVRLLRLF